MRTGVQPAEPRGKRREAVQMALPTRPVHRPSDDDVGHRELPANKEGRIRQGLLQHRRAGVIAISRLK